jgi:hypothetical protein
MAKARKGGRKQGQVPGTERLSIPELESAAEAYRRTVADRMAIQRTEADQKAHLSGTLHRFIDDKTVKVIEGSSIEQVVHRYEDEDGITRDIKFAHGKETIKVNKSDIEKD